MIREHNGALTFKGKSGPPYTATVDRVLSLTRSYLPAPLEQLRKSAAHLVESLHVKHMDGLIGKPEGDIDQADIHDALSALIVIASLTDENTEKIAFESYCRTRHPDTWVSSQTRRSSGCCVCTLPAGHENPEHVAQAFNDAKVIVCARWPVDDD